jgi:hypothetical protein
MWRENKKKEIGERESMRREKYVRNRVDLIGCLVEEKDRRNRRERYEMTLQIDKNDLI